MRMMMNEFEAQVLSDLSVLKTQMTGLMGDGNGGRIADLERRMEQHEYCGCYNRDNRYRFWCSRRNRYYLLYGQWLPGNQYGNSYTG